MIAPWTIRNAVRFHAFVPVSNNVATLDRRGQLRRDLPRFADRSVARDVLAIGSAVRTLPQAQACFAGFDISDPHFDEAKAASTDTHAGLSYARHHLGSLPKVAAVRVLRTWGCTRRPNK